MELIQSLLNIFWILLMSVIFSVLLFGEKIKGYLNVFYIKRAVKKETKTYEEKLKH